MIAVVFSFSFTDLPSCKGLVYDLKMPQNKSEKYVRPTSS